MKSSGVHLPNPIVPAGDWPKGVGNIRRTAGTGVESVLGETRVQKGPAGGPPPFPKVLEVTRFPHAFSSRGADILIYNVELCLFDFRELVWTLSAFSSGKFARAAKFVLRALPPQAGRQTGWMTGPLGFS